MNSYDTYPYSCCLVAVRGLDRISYAALGRPGSRCGLVGQGRARGDLVRRVPQLRGGSAEDRRARRDGTGAIGERASKCWHPLPEHIWRVAPPVKKEILKEVKKQTAQKEKTWGGRRGGTHSQEGQDVKLCSRPMYYRLFLEPPTIPKKIILIKWFIFRWEEESTGTPNWFSQPVRWEEDHQTINQSINSLPP